eukprot:TRINITY_DN3859_c0_g1_i2.p1 TRINITY_DN3859_c0_g1~~TRINITY_DN3859_c0_g1_i2.p1  ORF type:complete len:660 (-),score=261.52 TRINITY_DN3859_c0_g1_i2:119-2098(-)
MKFFKAVAASALLSAVPASGLTTLTFDASDKERPVTKIVNLLKGVREQLEKEGEEDKKTYDTYKCWCTTNGEEKAKAAAEAVERIKKMKARVTELTATSARLEVEYTNLGKDVEKLVAAADKARAIRKKEVEEFTAEETDLLKNLDATNSALQTVKAGSFLQAESSIKNRLNRIIVLQGDLLSDRHRTILNSFLQQQNPGSDMVMGVLTSLQADFTDTLADKRAINAKAEANYKALMKANRAETDAAKEAIDNKKDEKAAADEEIMQKKQDIKDTEETAGKDALFAVEVKEKCRVFEAEFATRTKTRADEDEAVAKAIEVLSDDDAHETFGRTLPTFVQVSATSKQQQLAAATLAAAGKLDARMTTLALQTQMGKLDGFYRVKKSIDEMLIALKAEHEDEVKQKDYCVEEFQENLMSTEKKQRTQNKQKNKIENLKVTIKQTSDAVVALQAEVAEMQKQLKLAAQNREAENVDFQQVVSDARSTQTLLNKALTVLKDFYTKSAAFAQLNAEANPEEPEKFKDYKKNGNSMKALSLLQTLINDAKESEAEAVSDERTAQENYEQFAKETSAGVDQKTADIDNKSDTKAKSEKELIETKEALTGTTDELMELATVNSDLHVTCDFVMQNFDVRQKARNQEMDALKQAKQYLNGAKFMQIKK